MIILLIRLCTVCARTRARVSLAKSTRGRAEREGVTVVLRQFKNVGQLLERHGGVVGRVGEDVRPQALLLDLTLEHRLHSLRVLKQRPRRETEKQLLRPLPVTLGQGSGGNDAVIAGALRRAGEVVLLVAIERTTQGAGDDLRLRKPSIST